ncbi:MAG: 3-dehydroquinate synthase [Anaerolineales bacterium]
MNLVLFGPPGSGKTTAGRLCAAQLGRDFFDTDEVIAARTGLTIPEIFAQQGEAAFRALESQTIAEFAHQDGLVLAVGGGALASAANRALVERNGIVVCLRAAPETIARRLADTGDRPLLDGDLTARLDDLLARRGKLYDSFAVQIWTDKLTPEAVARKAALALPVEVVVTQEPVTYPIIIGNGVRTAAASLSDKYGLPSPDVIVTDTRVGDLWGDALGAQLDVPVVRIPAGESHKTLGTVSDLYSAFLRYNLDRSSLVLALGGGVVGDTAGFAAATYMRGIRWISLPTTVLAMVDASLGGKVGVDLPEGKNLAGAFHPPALVVADPDMLATLPPAEYTAGLAEVVKHGLIADPDLFELLPDALPLDRDLIARAMQVKIDIVQRDPLEQGERAKLNLGHTIGHGLEAASEYRLRHGEAVAVGMVAEARLAEQLGAAAHGLASRIAEMLRAVGLPTMVDGLDPQRVFAHMGADKKKRAGRLHFALPTAIGQVQYGVTAADELVVEAIDSVIG